MEIATPDLRRLAYISTYMAELAREKDALDKQVSSKYGDGVHQVQDLDEVLEITVYGAFVRVERVDDDNRSR